MNEREVNELAASLDEAARVLLHNTQDLVLELDRLRKNNRDLANWNVDYRLENNRLREGLSTSPYQALAKP